MEANDPVLICLLANCYHYGSNGIQQNHARAIELLTRAAELGFSKAHNHLGDIYHEGGVEKGQVPQRGCGYGRT